MHQIPSQEVENTVPLMSDLSNGSSSLKGLMEALSKLRIIRRQFQPDLTVAYYMSSYGLLASLSGCKPWIGVAAGGDVLPDAYDSLAWRLRNWSILKFTLPRCDGMLAWAPHMGARLVELGFPREKTLIQPRGVDLRLFRYRPPRVRVHNDPLRISSIRRFKPLYRLDTLIEALAILAETDIPFEARIGGDGPERKRLIKLAQEKGILASTQFIGIIPPDHVPQELGWADTYVSTSCSDGASSSLFEALAVGLYPVVTDIPANRHFIRPGVIGDLFPVGDAQTLAKCLIRLARSDMLRRTGIQAARPIVTQDLDYQRNMSRIQDFLEDTIRHRA